MTLLYRLLACLFFGAVIATGAYLLLWPKPMFAGDYSALVERGRYGMRLQDDGTALMTFENRKGKRFAYKGSFKIEKDRAHVQWTEQRSGDDWKQLRSPIADVLEWQDKDHVKTREGILKRK